MVNVSGVREFIIDQSEFEKEPCNLMGWEYIDNQTKGDGADCIAPDGTMIELKFDWDSVKTGNHYLEYAQSNDDGGRWAPSGFPISLDEAELWVVINEDWIRVFRVKLLKRFISENRSRLKRTRTRAGVNRNRPGQLTKGYLIPFEELDGILTSKIASPIKRK